MTDDNRLKDPAVNSEPIAAVGGITEEMQKELDEIMLKYDKESTYRRLSDYRGTIIAVIAIIFSLIQLYHTFNPLPYIRPLHVGFVMLLAFLLYPAKKSMRKDTIPWYDVALAVIAFGVCMYQVINLKNLNARLRLQDYERILAIIGIVLLLEATRRVVGLPIVIIASTFILIALFGKYMPGFLRSNNSWKRIVEHLWYDQEGVFGTAIGACTTFIFLFILFGAFLEKTGVGEFFIDLANTLAGASRGGPAKVAVVSSGLFGTVSGSSVANTVGTGSFTIPMMKKMGYRPQFAGAVEAAASTGGQIMPPVMGAAAFLMVDSIGLPYGQIIKAAVIPAMLYFAGILLIVDLESKKYNLLGLPKDKLPKVRTLMSERGHLMAPLAIIIYVLVGTSLTPAFAALIGIAVAAVIGYVKTLMDLLVPNTKTIETVLNQRTGLRAKNYLECLESGARGTLSVALACATSGVVSGVITVTGIGARIGDGFARLAGGNLMLLLFFTMITSILLGMGVPTTANYLITSTIMAPIVHRALVASMPALYAGLRAIGLGYDVLPAHLFTFYFGIIADITPPVALAAMAGAAIAKSDPLKTGVEATKIAIAAFVVPFIFVYNPQMLMLNAQWYEVVLIAITALIGMFGLGMGVEGYYESKLNILQRLMAAAGGLLLIIPGLLTDGIGLVLIALVVIWQKMQNKGHSAGQQSNTHSKR